MSARTSSAAAAVERSPLPPLDGADEIDCLATVRRSPAYQVHLAATVASPASADELDVAEGGIRQAPLDRPANRRTVVTKPVVDGLDGPFSIDKLEETTVKGRGRPVRVFALKRA